MDSNEQCKFHTHNACCQDAPEPYGTSDSISLPVYASDARDRVVTSFILPCGGNKGQWLQSGAALFLRTQ